jgi:hypothetical protein
MNSYRLYIDIDIDSDDEPDMAFLADAASQLDFGLRESDAFPDLAEAAETVRSVYFVGSGVVKL